MAKTLAQGRKPGSGRKPGKAKTLAQGRKPGSGRKKRQHQQDNIINSIIHTDNHNSTVNLHQNQLTMKSTRLLSSDLPTTNSSSSSSTSIPKTNNISTRDMVAVDALRELTHSPLSVTSSNINNQNSHNNNNVNMSNPAVMDNLMLPPLNEVINYTDPLNPTDKHTHNSTNNNNNDNDNPALKHINSNDSIVSHLNHSESNTTPFINKLNNNNSTHVSTPTRNSAL